MKNKTNIKGRKRLMLFNRDRIILDLCGGTGAWSKPYKDAGYDVRVITLPEDVRLVKIINGVYGILAAVPCTHFSVSGARWWKEKGEVALLEGLAIADACCRFVVANLRTIEFWCFENPVGRLKHYYGKPDYYFHPHYFGDPYTKKTCLWGKFNIPEQTHWFENNEIDDRIHKMPPSEDRATLRSITPPGFAKAFFESNQ